MEMGEQSECPLEISTDDSPLTDSPSYVVFDATSTNIYGWRNGALAPGPPQYWYGMRGVFSGLPQLDLAGWRFVDLNGDKKDDRKWCTLLNRIPLSHNDHTDRELQWYGSVRTVQ